MTDRRSRESGDFKATICIYLKTEKLVVNCKLFEAHCKYLKKTFINKYYLYKNIVVALQKIKKFYKSRLAPPSTVTNCPVISLLDSMILNMTSAIDSGVHVFFKGVEV